MNLPFRALWIRNIEADSCYVYRYKVVNPTSGFCYLPLCSNCIYKPFIHFNFHWQDKHSLIRHKKEYIIYIIIHPYSRQTSNFKSIWDTWYKTSDRLLSKLVTFICMYQLVFVKFSIMDTFNRPQLVYVRPLGR